MPRGSPGTVLLDATTIAAGVARLATEIDQAYAAAPGPLVLVCVLKGSCLFAADLARAIDSTDVQIDFLGLASYGDATRSSGVVQITYDLSHPVEGKDVLIVEDIVDTGLTLTYLQDILRARNPRVLRTAALLSKPSRRQVDVKVEYTGFTIEDRFVVGYGLDYAEQYRNLPYIAVLEDS